MIIQVIEATISSNQDKERTRYNSRSCNKLLSETPLVKTKKTLGDKSFQVATPSLWNTLLSEIRAIRGYDLFKGAIKTYLFKMHLLVTSRASVSMITRIFQR